MRIVGEIPHTDCKITLYHWNNRYLIKLEKDYLEQTFKVNQFDLTTEADVTKLVNDVFITEAVARFSLMEQSLDKALQSL